MPSEVSIKSKFVQIQSLGMRFDEGPQVLEDINLEVAEHEFVTLIGPSGCGKSTLLRILSGLISNYSGSVSFKNHSPADAPDDSFFVFQDATLLPWLRVQANVELPLKIKGVAKEERKIKANEMIKIVGLEDDKHKFPWQLSGGMAMRVSIARALSISPKILLMDEPFGSLDEMTRDRLNEDLLKIREEDSFTAFYVTHSVAEALFLSTKVVVLSSNPGRIETIIEVPFSYPRQAALREQPEYLELLAKTTHALREANQA